MDANFVLDLASAVDYIGDLDACLHKCETESLPCDIQYLKDKVADIKFDLDSMMDRLCKGRSLVAGLLTNTNYY